MKKQVTYEMITPVLIQFEKLEWVHPEIENVLKWEIDGINPGKWSYDGLTRIYIENDKKQHAYLVVLSKDLEDDKIPMLHVLMQLEVLLFDDTWMPGEKQFCFTKFGKVLHKSFGYGKGTHITFASPDVGIQNKNGAYSWSS